MALKKTQLLDIQSVTGIATVGIFTVGVTQTAGGVGVASTSYIKNVIMHNTGLGTARVSMYINPNLTPGPALAVTANRFLRVDLAPNETTFFESTYPILRFAKAKLKSRGTNTNNCLMFIYYFSPY